MNRPVYFLELKAPDTSLTVEELVGAELKKINEPQKRINSKDWAVYCSDRLQNNWKKRVKPRSKLVLAARFTPQIDLNIVLEHKAFIVVDKPVNLPTQKTLKAHEDNLYDQVRLFFIQQKGFPVGLPYVGLHHRLDRGTSGLVLMTKQRQANKSISSLFKDRKIHKEYLAYVEWGQDPLPSSWRQKDFIRRGRAHKKKFFFEVAETGDEAITDFKVLEACTEKYYLIECRPKTGRTHQLRVQLSHAGHAILGDAVYGDKKSASRMMLHADKLSFSFDGQEFICQSHLNFKMN